MHKVYIDDESYNSGHGQAYKFYGVDPEKGATAIVRPDQCKRFLKLDVCLLLFTDVQSDVSMVTGLGDYQDIKDFFLGFAIPSTSL